MPGHQERAPQPQEVYKPYIETEETPIIKDRREWLEATTNSAGTRTLLAVYDQWRRDIPQQEPLLKTLRGSSLGEWFNEKMGGVRYPEKTLRRTVSESIKRNDGATLEQLQTLSRDVVKTYKVSPNWQDLTENQKRSLRLAELTAVMIESLTYQKKPLEYPQERWERLVPALGQYEHSKDIPSSFKEDIIFPYIKEARPPKKPYPETYTL